MEEYSMKSRGFRGLFLLIVNKTFRHLPERLGCERDADRLREAMLARGFEVEEHRDCSNAEIRKLMWECAADQKHANADCFVCGISSHGFTGGGMGGGTSYGSSSGSESGGGNMMARGERCIMGVDSTEQNGVALDQDIIEVICRCEALVGKPKIFLVQACQGHGVMRTVRKLSHMQSDSVPSASAVMNLEEDEEVPLWADVLVLESTLPGYKAYRSVDEGSIFVTKFQEVMDRYGDNHHMSEIAALLSKELARVHIPENSTSSSGYSSIGTSTSRTHRFRVLQQCYVRSTLTKNLYLRRILPRVTGQSLPLPGRLRMSYSESNMGLRMLTQSQWTEPGRDHTRLNMPEDSCMTLSFETKYGSMPLAKNDLENDPALRRCYCCAGIVVYILVALFILLLIAGILIYVFTR